MSKSTMQNNTDIELTPWHRVPMVWMLIAFPLSSVLVGLLMLFFAIDSYDGLVSDDYQKQRKEINRTLARNDFALSRGIIADLRFLPQSGILKLQLSSRESLALTDTLLLKFVHRTRAGRDIEVMLQKSGQQEYIAPIPQLAPSNWIVQLETSDWRISGLAPIPGSGLIKLDAQ